MKTSNSKPRSTAVAIYSLAIGLSMASFNASAASQCYSFDKMQEGRDFKVGDSVNAKRALIEFYPYFNENLEPVQDDGVAKIENNAILDSPPTLHLLSKILFRVTPNKRVKRVTVRYAENTGVDNNQIVNLGVNGELLSWRGTLGEKEGSNMGLVDVGGRVSVHVTREPHGDGNWVKGTLTLESDPIYPWLPNRGIDRFALGRSSQLLVDDVCLEN